MDFGWLCFNWNRYLCVLACRSVFKAQTYRYSNPKIGVAMRWLFFIFFLFPSIALAGQVEQEEVDHVLDCQS